MAGGFDPEQAPLEVENGKHGDMPSDNQSEETMTTLVAVVKSEQVAKEATAETEAQANDSSATESSEEGDNNAEEDKKEDANPQTPDRKDSYDLWIGEGLLDITGMEAMERLSDLDMTSIVADKAPFASIAEVKNEDTAEEAHTEELTASAPVASPSSNKLLNFLAKEEPKEAPVVATPEHPVAPVVPPYSSAEKRRNKLLDFLANDIGEQYLNDVYSEKEREPVEVPSVEVQSKVVEENVDNRRPLDRTKRANSRLMAFLAKESGERLHKVEASSGDESSSDRNSISSASSSVSSPANSEQRRRQKPLGFVVKQLEEKPKMVIYNPDDAVSPTQKLEQFVAEEAERKKMKREQKEAARLKVLEFLKEEEAADREHAHESTIKSVDESSVERETIVDEYGASKLLDFLDHTEGAKQRKIRATIMKQRSGSDTNSSHSESSSTSSSPKSSETSTPPRPAVAPSPSGRLTAFLSKVPSTAASLGSSSTGDNAQTQSTPPPKPVSKWNMLRYISSSHHISTQDKQAQPSSAQSKTSPTNSTAKTSPPKTVVVAKQPTKVDVVAALAAASVPATKEPEAFAADGAASTTRSPSAKMSVLLASLNQITEKCEAIELSDISIARISTLLSSINQIVKDDMQKTRVPASMIRRRSSAANTADSPGTPTWVKSSAERAEFEKNSVTVSKPMAPTPRVILPPPMPSVLNVSGEPSTAIATTVMDSFRAFESAQNMIETLATFQTLMRDCGLENMDMSEPLRVYPRVKAAVFSKMGFRQKQLFKLLDSKLSQDVYKRQPSANKRVCVIGAGPVGLRAAVENALLGAQVVLIEKRKHFSRENILHLWPWVVQDVTSLGGKVFFPQFCHSTAYFHVGTRQLQCILLKVALLLGVTVFPSTSFEGIARPDSSVNGRKSYYSIITKPQIPWMEFSAVLGAAGTQDILSDQAGIKRFVFSRKEAIGIVCYFPNLGSTEEKKVGEFSWTIQFKQQMFARMRERGVDLENIVYYRGEMHYLVMTPKRANLVKQGVLKFDYPNTSDLVMDSNVDKNALHMYVERVVDFLQIPKKSTFERVRIFDFSTRTRADKAASVLSSKGKKLYVGLIGDALMEPFWPEGLGTCRGFLSALDGCWMISQIGKKADEQILADREMAYRVIQHVSGFRREDLQPNVRQYNVDPKTRYTIKFPQLC